MYYTQSNGFVVTHKFFSALFQTKISIRLPTEPIQADIFAQGYYYTASMYTQQNTSLCLFWEVLWTQYGQSATTSVFKAQLYHIENVYLQLADSGAQTAKSTPR